MRVYFTAHGNDGRRVIAQLRHASGWWCGWICTALIVLAAIGFSASSLDLRYVDGTGPYWRGPPGDAAQGQIAWFYYARDAWRFPLTAIGSYHLPEGSNLLLGDALPLFALPMKAWHRWWQESASAPPIYTGFWVALCMALQLVAGSRLLSALGVRRPAQHVAGLILLCWMPMLFLRFGHASLMAHFILLVALSNYVRAGRGCLAPKTWALYGTLPALALTIHPYLAAMALLPTTALLVEQRRLGFWTWRAVALGAAWMLGVTVVIAALLGYFTLDGRGFNDYGEYSLNLLAPWVPWPTTALGRWLGTQPPSITGLQQWEGGCYLGAGLIALMVAALARWQLLVPGLRRHCVLAAFLAVAVLFAISNRVGVGATEWVHIALPDGVIALLSTFRGSGRFVWPAVYAFAALLIVTIVRGYRPAVATAILCVCAALQLIDVLPMQHAMRTASATGQVATIDRGAWEQLVRSHSTIFQYPSFECGGLFGGDISGTRWRELEIDWIAARLDRPTNSAYLARYTKDCAAERSVAAQGPTDPGTLYLYRDSEDVGAMLSTAGAALRRCHSLDDVVVCEGRPKDR